MSEIPGASEPWLSADARIRQKDKTARTIILFPDMADVLIKKLRGNL
jgi:hypothetical protein